MNWINCSDLRREARNSLRGRWGLAVGTFLIGGIIHVYLILYLHL